MFNKKLRQNGGENSTNLQANNINLYSGITFTEAKDIALDVFKANFLDLSVEAANLAQKRAEEITDKFINELHESIPKSLNLLNDPDVQYALFSAQKEYARSGEKDLEDILINILLERVQGNSHSLKRIVLNEALRIVPMLTKTQLDSLSIVFLIQETQNIGIINKEKLQEYIIRYIKPFLGNISSERTDYKHLTFTGCCSQISMHQNVLVRFFVNPYKKLFSKGFIANNYLHFIKDYPELEYLLIPCANNDKVFQLDVMNDAELKIKLTGYDEDLIEKLISLINHSTMSSDEAIKFIRLVAIREKF